MELPDAAVLGARLGFNTEWLYASTRAVGQSALFVIGRPEADLRRLYGSRSESWAEEWNSGAV